VPIRAVFDSNIHIRLEKEPKTVAKLNQVIAAGVIEIIMPRSVADEIIVGTGIPLPEPFPVRHVGHSVARMGMMRCGDSFGAGAMYDAVLGNGSDKHKADALIADVASYANWFVCEDARISKRFSRNLAITICTLLTYNEFCEKLANLMQSSCDAR
jgi:hypothetical protein